MPHHYINDNFRKARGINNDLDLLMMNHLRELVDNNEDWVIVVSLSVYQKWQTRDKIY